MFSIYSAITVLIASIDLYIKNWVEKNIPFQKDKKILKSVGILRKVHNKGMMLNFAEKHSNLVKIISVVVTTFVLFTQLLISKQTAFKKESFALAFVLGGAISNTVDRVKRGYVVDYLAWNNKNKKISKVTYNIGDFAIFAGIFLILLASIVKEK